MGMLRLSSVVEIDSAHYLKDYDGKCANLHGHRWRVEVILEGRPDELDGAGMVCDFGVVKEILKRYDHAIIVKDTDVEEFKGLDLGILDRMIEVDFNTTAENLSVHWAEEIMLELLHRGLKAKVKEVRVWETPNNLITYFPDKE